MPDPAIPTEESGTRHRTAQRVALQTGLPGHLGVAVDAHHQPLHRRRAATSWRAAASCCRAPTRPSPPSSGTSPAWTRSRNALSALEIEDLVTVRDAAVVSQRLEMVRRIADEVTGQVVELGTDGRLLALQLDELMAGVDADRELIARDYVPTGRRAPHRRARCCTTWPSCRPSTCSTSPRSPARMGLPSTPEGLESAVSPRGYRLLARVPRIPGAILDRVVEHFGGLQKLLAASVEDLQVVDGVGESRARAVREGISRLAEVSIIDRFS